MLLTATTGNADYSVKSRLSHSGQHNSGNTLLDYVLVFLERSTEEKRPQLFANLADDLQPLCINLQQHYMAMQRDLDSQPHEIEAMKARELERLSQQLQQVGAEFFQHIEEEVNSVVTNGCPAFEEDFRKLQARMIRRLDKLLDSFSVRLPMNVQRS